MLKFTTISLSLVFGSLGVIRPVIADEQQRVDFNYHIKPILSDRCFPCHGPDENKREAELRLDTRAGAFRMLAKQSHVIKPGDPSHSAVYLRISSTDDDFRMPPPDSKLSLSATEVSTIKRWIEQGAEWKDHWSFIPLEPVVVPKVQNQAWVRNAIDGFVLRRLERGGHKPTREAIRERLIRRLSFDLTGLPPTLEEIDKFLEDKSPDAYERVVDRLLKSNRYGERMAVDWLDLARYADTYGYQSDVYRAMWPWRDWVIGAFNDNLPFDQFITWQLAGDLLPTPKRDQILATAFNRHHRQTNEGGSIEKEWRVEYVADRTNTLGAVFLGLTLECSRCHDHKFDPIKQKEYYQLFSFFNSIDESGLYSHFTNSVPTPTLLLTTEDQQKAIETIEQQIQKAETKRNKLVGERAPAFAKWLQSPNKPTSIDGLIGDFAFEKIAGNKVVNRADAKQPGSVSEGPKIVAGRVGNGLQLSGENNVSFAVGGKFTRNDPFSIALWLKTPQNFDRAVVFHRSRSWTDAGSRGYQLLFEDGRLSASLIHFWPGNAIRIRTTTEIPIDRWIHTVMTYDGSSRASGLKLYLNGKLHPSDVVRDKLSKNMTGGGANRLTIGQRFRDRGFKNGLVDEFQIYRRTLTSIEVQQIHDGRSLTNLLALKSNKLNKRNSNDLFEYYLANHDSSYREHLESLRKLRLKRSQVVDSIAEIMVMQEMVTPRETYLLNRGVYDAPRDRVYPGTPASLLSFDDRLPRNRLGLAQWLTDRRHPLTARVTVNRFWQALFGRGLVATPEDFGSQGELPSHPKLLDWLALSLIESHWDVKALLKTIVMSATYRQTSVVDPKYYASDPENVMLSRGPRYRLPAEMIRDNALLVSGLLVSKTGGPSVKPYQPAGLWKEKSGRTYQRDKGDGSHRRSLYSYWKRTSPPPAMMTLDAAKRDVCVVKRQATATPLQALVLLNDPQYTEAARSLAERALRQGGKTLNDQIVFVFRTLTSRRPNEKQVRILASLYQEQLDEFKSRPADAERLLKIGDHKPNQNVDRLQLAAMSVLVKTLMSFDESVMKR